MSIRIASSNTDIPLLNEMASYSGKTVVGNGINTIAALMGIAKLDAATNTLVGSQIPSNVATKNGEGVNYVVVDISSDNAITNGSNLLAAYAAAKLLTPNGAVLAADNKAWVLVPPAVYDLDDANFEIDNDYVGITSIVPGGCEIIHTSIVITSTAAIIQGFELDILPDQNSRYAFSSVQGSGGIAYIGGDKSSSNTRGPRALDIQSYRANTTEIASGANSSTFGNQNTASGAYAGAVGKGNEGSGNSSSAFGYENTASGNYASAIGANNTASGYRSSALGRGNSASGYESSAFGHENNIQDNASCAFGRVNTTSGYYHKNSAFGIANSAAGGRASAFGYYNTASGNYASAFGYKNTSSGYHASAFGYNNDATNLKASAFGNNNNASGESAAAFGYENTASGNLASALGASNSAQQLCASAIGYFNVVSGNSASAIGCRVTTTVANTQEFGYWSDSTTRSGAVRVHSTGMVALTVQDKATEYGDGGTTAGSEADDTLGRSMFAIRRNGLQFILDYNDAGTIKSIILGVAV